MEEIGSYRAQIDAIENLLADDQLDIASRQEMEQTKNDLLELVQLLEEELGDQSTVETSICGVKKDEEVSEKNDEYDSDDDDVMDMDDVVGTRCMAPFSSVVSLSRHAAIIFDVKPGVDEHDNKVTVLFSHPMTSSMRPCVHFMSSTCRYSDNCRFSHGHLVELAELREYEQPDFDSMKEDSLVLVQLSSELWELGRITAFDGQEVAVKLLKSGQEVSSNRGKLVPIVDDTHESSEKAESTSTYVNDSWSELKGSQLGNVSVSEIGDWAGPSGGIGMRLMQKMGYKLGQGLGKRNDGIVHAIQATICPKNASVDECMRRKRKVIDGKTIISAKKAKRMAEKLARANESEKDIFVFINRKLERNVSTKPEHVRIKDEKRELETHSTKSLGIKGVDLEIEMKQLRAKEKKLKEGISRNKADPTTVSRLKTSLREIENDIERVERKQRNVHRELKDRNKNKKDIF